jgi:hypothetical protein
MRKRITNRSEQVKTAAASGVRRQISEDFKYNKAKLKHLKNVLHKVTVSLGTMVSAHNEFARVKGPEISPDGLLGGLGYIIPIKEIKEIFNSSIRTLSDVADCIADELTNPKWEASSDTDVQKLIKEKKEIDEQVEEDVPEAVDTKDTKVDDGDSDAYEEIDPEDIKTSEEFKPIAPENQKALAKAVQASLAKAVNYRKG